MTARFILSLDCEGKWGIADRLTSWHRWGLSDAKLEAAYQAIVDLLDDYGIAATFAFVGAFSQSASDFLIIRPALEKLAPFAPSFVGAALADIRESGGDGWHGEHLVHMAASSRTSHEIALQGVTHVPWTLLDARAARTEMELFSKLRGPVGKSKTFIFPRNRIAHTEILEGKGFAGYRTARAPRPRILSLLSELNIREVPEPILAPANLVPIPAGLFLNWRHGLRRLVPPGVTQLRVRHLLKTAAELDGVVHFWLHPENVASAPETLGLLRMLAHEVARAREAGNCEVLTQIGYCRQIRSMN